MHLSPQKLILSQLTMSPETAPLRATLLLVLLFVTGSHADFMNCQVAGTAASSICSEKMSVDLTRYGGSNCCIVAKLKHCLTQRMGDSCGRQVESLSVTVMNKLMSEASGCGDYEYVSATCLYFFYEEIVLSVAMVIFVLIATIVIYNLLSCCIDCVRDCVRSCCHPSAKSKYEIAHPLSRTGEPLVFIAPRQPQHHPPRAGRSSYRNA